MHTLPFSHFTNLPHLLLPLLSSMHTTSEPSTSLGQSEVFCPLLYQSRISIFCFSVKVHPHGHTLSARQTVLPYQQAKQDDVISVEAREFDFTTNSGSRWSCMPWLWHCKPGKEHQTCLKLILGVIAQVLISPVTGILLCIRAADTNFSPSSLLFSASHCYLVIVFVWQTVFAHVDTP